MNSKILAIIASLTLIATALISTGTNSSNQSLIDQGNSILKAATTLKQAEEERSTGVQMPLEDNSSCKRGTFSSANGPTEWACGCDNAGSGWVDQGQGCYHRIIQSEVESEKKQLIKEIAELDDKMEKCLDEKVKLEDPHPNDPKMRLTLGAAETTVEALRQIGDEAQQKLDRCRTKLNLAKLEKQRENIMKALADCYTRKNSGSSMPYTKDLSSDDGQRLITLHEDIGVLQRIYSSNNCSSVAGYYNGGDTTGGDSAASASSGDNSGDFGGLGDVGDGSVGSADGVR